MNALQFPIGAVGSLPTSSGPPCSFIERVLGAQAFIQLHVTHVLVVSWKNTSSSAINIVEQGEYTYSVKAIVLLWASAVYFPHPSFT